MKYFLTLLLTLFAAQAQNIIATTTGRDAPLISAKHISNGRIKLTNLARTDLSNNPLTIGTTPIAYELGGTITNHLLVASLPSTIDITPGRSRKAFIVLTNGVPFTTNATYNFNIIVNGDLYLIGVTTNIPPGEVEPPTQKTVKLQWDANTENDLAGYFLYQGSSSGVYDTTNDVGFVTSFIINGLTAGSTNFYAVKAYTTAALESVSFSNEVSENN